jgi:phosphatidylserine decarboxylase
MRWPWATESWVMLAFAAVLIAAGPVLVHWGTRVPWMRPAGWVWVIMGGLIALAALVFFRDPERTSTAWADRVLAPADGRIMAVETVTDPRFGSGPMQRVATFMHLGNVHVQRTPFAGRLARTEHRPGRFHPAFKAEAARENEQRWYTFATDRGQYAVVQIAGLLARRTIPWVRDGAACARGERLGMIAFGSEVDLYLPPTVRLTVRVGDRVRAGETEVGTWPR